MLQSHEVFLMNWSSELKPSRIAEQDAEMKPNLPCFPFGAVPIAQVNIMRAASSAHHLLGASCSGGPTALLCLQRCPAF